MADFAEGTALLDGRYTLERRLGAGGMAAVWLARDEVLDRPVAIKTLSDLLAHDEAFVQRFTREARVAAGLSHANLVRVFDVGDEPSPYLVMEYVEGGTLADRLRAGDRGFDAAVLIHCLLEALAHVHAARIVHRDVKPANVLMGTDGRARLTDFGIALPEDATTLTQDGGLMGTMKYLAPEVLGGAPATPLSDLYSLGMLLRECIDPGEGPLDDLADRLTQRDPADRPQSAEEALAMLGEETVPLAASPPTASTRAMALRPQPRRRYALAAAALAAVVLVIALATGGGDGGGLPAAPPRTAPLDRQLDGLERAVEAAP